MSRKAAVVVTTYNPNLQDLEENLRSYAHQVDVVVVTDNSDTAFMQQSVEQLVRKFTSVYLNQLFENAGIARAQNLGVDLAIKQGCEFFIEIDQDSRLPEGYVSSLLQSFDRLDGGRQVVGGIGPLIKTKDIDAGAAQVVQQTGCVEVEHTLSSGFLMPLHAYRTVGGKDEELFIDYVDWDWCWRSRSAGLAVYVDRALTIGHELGDGHKNICGLKIGISSPIRNYFQYRNFFLLLRKPHVPMRWKIKYLFILAAKLPVYFLFLDKKLLRGKFLLKGIKDGLLGRSGKIR